MKQEPETTETESKERPRRTIGLAGLVGLSVIMGVGSFSVAAATRDQDARPPATTILPQPPPVESIPYDFDGHPQEGYYESEEAEGFRLQLESGWKPVGTGQDSDVTGWVPTAFFYGDETPRSGEAVEVVDDEMNHIGYLVLGLGFVPKDTFDAPDFDWRAFAYEKFPEHVAADRIADIEYRGGIKPVERISDLTG